jgi:REP element-mobilizing transposase RayT
MPVRIQHAQQAQSIYFITFTCFKWKHLFQIADAWNAVYKWFDALYTKNVRVNGYVIMPNHVHCLLYFPAMRQSLNTIIGNAKRFIAYEIMKRLKEKNEVGLHTELHDYVKRTESKKGRIHKAF